MSCTTILVGKKASYDGSTIIARNEDSSSTGFCPKKFLFIRPKDQPKKYKSVLSHVEIDLPENPLSYTVMPNADPKEGIWGAAGVNAKNVAMTATETLTTNVRVAGADPFVDLVEQKGKKGDKGKNLSQRLLLSLLAAGFLPYLLGLPYMAYILNTVQGLHFGGIKILQAGFLAFLPGDLAKVAMAYLITRKTAFQRLSLEKTKIN